MTNKHGPEGVAPDDQRCDALVKGVLSAYMPWQREDRRCPKKASQCRDGYAVCWAHARVKTIQFWGLRPTDPKYFKRVDHALSPTPPAVVSPQRVAGGAPQEPVNSVQSSALHLDTPASTTGSGQADPVVRSFCKGYGSGPSFSCPTPDKCTDVGKCLEGADIDDAIFCPHCVDREGCRKANFCDLTGADL